MSRIKKFTRSLASGYLQVGVNGVYTLASISLALHYLTPKDFALWQVAASVAGYLMLLDFGLTGSAARILIDHKDNPAGGAYGSVIKISIAVSLIQGFAIAVLGLAVSFLLPRMMNLSAQFPDPAEAAAAGRALFLLTAGLCGLRGAFFVTRSFWNLAQAHKRFDLYNYAQTGGLVASFIALWIGFHRGLGVYSILAGNVASSVFGFFAAWFTAARCDFLPPRGTWGPFD